MFRCIIICCVLLVSGCQSGTQLTPSMTQPKPVKGVDVLIEKGVDDLGYYEIWVLKDGKKVRRFWFKSGKSRDMQMHY
jgi:hypothetical protein